MATVHFTLHAQRLLGSGKTSQAIAVLEEGLKEYPDYATAYALLARAYLQLQDIPTAYEIAAHAVQRFPYHRGLALLHEQLLELLRSDQTLGAIVEIPSSADELGSIVASSDASNLPSAITESKDLDVGEPDASLVGRQEGTRQPEAATEFLSPPGTDAALLEDRVQEPAPDSKTHAREVGFVEDSLDEESRAALQIADSTTAPAGDDVQDATVRSAQPRENDASPTMRIVETATIDSRAMRMLRSSNVRLIPGLEFAPLRIESSASKPSAAVLEFPPFRPIRGTERQRMVRSTTPVPSTPAQLEAELRARQRSPDVAHTSSTDSSQKTSLELLAERLEQAWIKSPESHATAEQSESDVERSEPTVVSETMAAIYEMQGAIEQAIKAYMILARQFP
ncbi:MAG: tetratricopeptide repeat protein, partial [Chlorobiota bacterium]